MTDHTEMQIPDDVMEAATVVKGAISGKGYDETVYLIASAILSERERCARIADRNDMSAWGIAREIRSVDK